MPLRLTPQERMNPKAVWVPSALLSVLILCYYLPFTRNSSKKYIQSTPKLISTKKATSDPPKNNQSGPVSYFTSEDYLESKAKKGSNFSTRLCINVTKFKIPPLYTICLHPTNKSVYTDIYFKGEVFEEEVTKLLLHMMKLLEKKDSSSSSSNSSLVYLDMGTNVGIHVLPMLAAGHAVWGLDAQKQNLAKVYQAASANPVGLERLRLIHNALDNTTGTKTYIRVHGKVNSASWVSNNLNTSTEWAKGVLENQPVYTIRLADIVKEVLANAPAKDVKVVAVLKMDIEHYECRAFLGSPDIFRTPRLFIAYISMEWTFYWAINTQGNTKLCSPDMQRSLIGLLLSRGYSPFGYGGEAMDVDSVDKWGSAAVVWRHGSAPDPWEK